MSFDEAFATTVGIEGGYSNNPLDSGGETMFGITVAVARNYGWQGEMSQMPIDFAKRVYRLGYWQRLHLDDVRDVAGERLATELFDAAVNCGQGTAVTFLQRALNVMNNRGKYWPDMVVDGNLGKVTLDALRAFMAMRNAQSGAIVMLRCLVTLRGAYYIGLAEKRQKDEAFVYGWILNRVSMI